MHLEVGQGREMVEGQRLGERDGRSGDACDGDRLLARRVGPGAGDDQPVAHPPALGGDSQLERRVASPGRACQGGERRLGGAVDPRPAGERVERRRLLAAGLRWAKRKRCSRNIGAVSLAGRLAAGDEPTRPRHLLIATGKGRSSTRPRGPRQKESGPGKRKRKPLLFGPAIARRATGNGDASAVSLLRSLRISLAAAAAGRGGTTRVVAGFPDPSGGWWRPCWR